MVSLNEGYVLLCDAVREEVGGKLSYMGCYSNGINIERKGQEGPVSLKNLCFVFSGKWELDGKEVDKEVLQVFITVPGAEKDIKLEYPLDALVQYLKENPGHENIIVLEVASMVFRISGEMVVRFVYNRDGEREEKEVYRTAVSIS